MTDAIISCPHCGGEIPLTEALTAQLHARFDAEHEARLRQAVAEAEKRGQAQLSRQVDALRKQVEAQAENARGAEAREIELRQKTLALEQGQSKAADKARLEVEEKLRRETDERTKTLVLQAEKKARDEVALEKHFLEAQLAEEQKKREVAQQAELALRKKADDLETRARELDLELARKLGEKKLEWEAGLRQAIGAEQELKLKEKEKQVDDLRRVIDDLKRKSQQGSQELQGEVLELDVQAALEARFPRDVIRVVPKGMQGADLLHDVRDATLNNCGSIVWEVKNTKNWQPAWIAKLKDDQRACGACVAVLISVALPDNIQGFGQVNGVWVASLALWPALAAVLREQLIQVAFARNAAVGMTDKMEVLYQYLAGDAFRHKVEAIVEAFSVMHEQLGRERRAMEKLWKEREKQLDRIITSTAGMYGELRGTIGQAMRPIAALELDAELLLGVEDE